MTDIEHSPDCNVDGGNDLMSACTCQVAEIAKLREANAVMREALDSIANDDEDRRSAYGARQALARVKEIMGEPRV